MILDFHGSRRVTAGSQFPGSNQRWLLRTRSRSSGHHWCRFQLRMPPQVSVAGSSQVRGLGSTRQLGFTSRNGLCPSP